MRTINKSHLLLCLILACLSGFSLAQRAERDPSLLNYEYGQDRTAFNVIEDQIRKADPKGREGIESELIGVLGSAKATAAAKQTAAMILPRVATCKSAAPLAQLIGDKEVTHAAIAALQNLPCPEVSRLIREKLPSVSGDERIEVVNALGQLRDRTALPFLTTLVKDSDEGIVQAVIAAIGRIGGEEGARALKSLSAPTGFQSAWADAYLTAADSLLAGDKSSLAAPIYRELLGGNPAPGVKAAALGGLVRAEGAAALPSLILAMEDNSPVVRNAGARFINQLPGRQVTDAMVAAMTKSPPSTQLLLISALEVRGDRTAVPALISLLSNADETVRLAAIRALGALGDDAVVPPLFKAVKGEETQSRTASESLRFLRGERVDPAIAQFLKDPDPALRVAALRILAARKYKPALPEAIAGTQHSEAAVRLEAWRALNDLAGPEEFPQLVDLLLKIQSPREQSAAEQAVQTVAARVADPERKIQPLLDAMPGKSAEARSSLVRLVAKIGGPKAMDVVRAAMRDDNAEVRDNAVRVLSEWGDQSTASDLLGVARQSESDSHRVLGLRGYIRLVNANENRPPGERLQMLREAIAVAHGPDARKLVLGALGGVADVGAFREIEPYMKDAEVRAEAEAAYSRVASSLRRSFKAEALAAYKKLAAEAQNANVREEAKAAIAELEK